MSNPRALTARASFCALALTALHVLMLLAAGTAIADPIILTPRITLSEEYNDNVRFREDKEDDFITSISPGVGLDYTSESLGASLNASTTAAIFAKGTTPNRIADNQSAGLSLWYQPTRRLNISLSDSLTHVSSARTGTSVPSGDPTSPGEPTPGDTVGPLLSGGEVFSNSFSLLVGYQLAPLWTASARYGNGYGSFTDDDAESLRNVAGLQLGYAWSPPISLNGGYTYTRFNLDTGTDTETHSVSLGGAYRYSALWSGSLSAGVYINRPLESDPDDISSQIGPTFSLAVIRASDRLTVTSQANQNITTSAGVAGVSVTRTVSLFTSGRLTEDLTGSLGLSYSNFDVSQTNFNVVFLTANLSYPIWRWVSLGLTYSYRWRDSGETIGTVEEGAVDGNVVQISATAWYPVWRGDL